MFESGRMMLDGSFSVGSLSLQFLKSPKKTTRSMRGNFNLMFLKCTVLKTQWRGQWFRELLCALPGFRLTFGESLAILLHQRAVSSAWESATMALWRSPVRPRYGPLNVHSVCYPQYSQRDVLCWFYG